MKKTILAVVGAGLLTLAALSSMGYGPVAAQQSYSQQQTGQQSTSQSDGNNTGTGNSTGQQTNLAATGRADANATEQLHAFLDAAIISAKNNDTHGMMVSLSQIMEGLGNMSNPVTQTAGANDTTSGQSAGNQTGTGNDAGSNSTSYSITDTNRAATGGKAGDVDTPVTEGPEQMPSDFPDR